MTNTSYFFGPPNRHVGAANRFVTVRGIRFAYRELGPQTGAPIVLFIHWGAVLGNFDLRIVDALATATHRVIVTDYRVIGASGRTVPLKVGETVQDMTACIRVLGFEQVDLLWFSLGGFVAQDVAPKAPGLVRKLILTGTGPAVGVGIDKVGAVSWSECPTADVRRCRAWPGLPVSRRFYGECAFIPQRLTPPLTRGWE